jgi:hypothetical protein
LKKNLGSPQKADVILMQTYTAMCVKADTYVKDVGSDVESQLEAILNSVLTWVLDVT